MFLSDEEPHLTQTNLPPNDLSETRSELPQRKQILLELMINPKFITYHSNYMRLYNVKNNFRTFNEIENLLQ